MSSKKLNVGDFGNDVTNLQENLKKQGFNVSAEEEKRKFFGPTTREAVGEFQKIHGIDPTCTVCEKTAAILAAQPASVSVEAGSVAEVGRFQNPERIKVNATASNITPSFANNDQKINLSNKISALALSTHGAPVKELQAQLVTLGVKLPENETSASIFGVGTRDALMQLQAKHNLNTTGILDDATRNAIAFELGNLTQPRRVEGRIYLDNGLPGSKVKLRIINKGFAKEEALLGEVETDERGFYALPYGLEDGSANIEMRALDTSGAEIRLSNPKVNADRSEVINLVAPSTVNTQSAEFKLMLDDLSTVKGFNLEALAHAQENDTDQDISFLNKTTDWDSQLITGVSIAAKLSPQTGISPDALYGVFRAGLPHDPEALATVSAKAFATALTQAKDAGIISLDDAQFANNITAFGTFKLDTLRKSIVPGALSSVGDMLAKAPIAADHKLLFEKLVLLHEGDNASLWEKAKDQGISDNAIKNLQLQGKLAYLTLNNATLVEALQSEFSSQDSLFQMVDKDLYRKEEWINRLNKLSQNSPENLAKLIPTAYSHSDANERLIAYAEDLAGKVRQSFPTHVVNRMLEKDELTLGTQHAELKTPVQSFLKNAIGVGFQLGSTPVDQFLKQHGETVFAGLTEEGKLLAETGAKLLTRVYQMTPDDESMSTLLQLGFTSARQVSFIPKMQFVDAYWQYFGSRKVTEKVWDKSGQITSTTFNIFSLGKKVESTPPIRAVSGSPEKHREDKDKLNSLLKEYPTMESLFGSLDFCECEHCRSVLSPAAYLVDLLRFIDPAPQDWEQVLFQWRKSHNEKDYTTDYLYLKPYDALIQRRPDLPHLPLTCENTNTALPYIDLVNEILEYFVANKQLDAKAAYDTGESTSAELIAEPHNAVPQAYDALKNACYPFILPFDLWIETVRRFCNYFATPFNQILDVFRSSDDLYAPAENAEAYCRAQIFTEYLGLSPTEHGIYTAPTFTDWPKLYGYDNSGDDEASVLAKLKSAKMLSRRLGVSYKELVDIIQTGFINSKLNTKVTLYKLGLELSDVFRYKKYAGFAAFTSEEETEFEKKLTQLTDKFKPNFDAKQWLLESWNQKQFEKIILLRDPSGICSSFDETLVTYSEGSDLTPLDYAKLNLFVRLWKKLGWPLEEIDQALQTFLPANVIISDNTLGKALKTAIIYFAHLEELNDLIGKGKQSRTKLLTLWTDLPIKGKNSLYSQLFLTRNILKDDAVFDDPLGNYLSQPGIYIKDHLPALQAALSLTADEIAEILHDGNAGDERAIDKAKLSLANVSVLYRYGLLAKLLKLSVIEMISIKALSGLNPFHPLSPDALSNIDADYPLQHSLEFTHCVRMVKASSFAIDDLNYLYRHQFDPIGKYRDNIDSKLSWIRLLSIELNKVANDFAIPSNGSELGDDALRQKMEMVFPPEVVETFMGFWLDKTVYSATKSNVIPNKRIDPKFYTVNNVTFSYDETRQRQQVTHIGILTSAKKTDLLNKIPQPVSNQDAIDARNTFIELLDQIVEKSSNQFEAFFDKYFEGLIKYEDFFGAGITSDTDGKRLGLLQKILPFLHTRLNHQMILQSLIAQINGDTELLELLVSNHELLALPDVNPKPLMSQFEGLGQRGLTATLSLTEANTAPVDTTADAVMIRASDKCTKALWRGGIEVPHSGSYRFYAKLGKTGATVKLYFDGMLEPVLDATAAKDDDELSEFVELKAGILYLLTIEANNLQEGSFELLVKGETTPKDKLNQLLLLPQAQIDLAIDAYIQLNKVFQIIQGLGLSLREVRHIFLNPKDFGNANWRLLPIKAEGIEANSSGIALFNTHRKLMQFVALKRNMAGEGDGLIAIFEYARLKNPESVQDLCKRVAMLTRRKPENVMAVAVELKMAEPQDFANLIRMERLWNALQVIEKFGVSMQSIKPWLAPQPNAEMAMDIRNTIKSRFEQETWQSIAKAVFDPLRQLQRDALVAYILHRKEGEGVDSMEKLFEYFLIDPGMEPVVQTSRLRLAISSLQTFIQRCFLNLEKQVHPSVLNSAHWSWMKNYRVWEANRKIFLFPENWLEPEWRDDKTHLYQELESSLMQGDVTNQLAEDAFYVYLKKLDQLARLEIVTMYTEEQMYGPPTMHVIGRTYLLPHQYFYRRYAHQMWSPWEPVNTEIDGDHIVVVMWRGRLHLFWLTFMVRMEESASPPTPAPKSTPIAELKGVKSQEGLTISAYSSSQSTPLAEMGVNELLAEANQETKNLANRWLDVQLNWSEYFQGEWTVRESSGFGNSIDITNRSFNPAAVYVTVSKETDPDTGTEGAVIIELNGIINRPYFRVVSKNSRPQFNFSNGSQPSSPYSGKDKNYNKFKGSGPLSVTFVQMVETRDGVEQVSPSGTQKILAKGYEFSLLQSSNQMKFPNAEFAPLISPFFYADHLYTFFVEPSITETTTDKWQGYTIPRPSQHPWWEGFVLNPPPVNIAIPPKYYVQEAFKNTQVIPQPDPVDSSALHSIKAKVDAVTQPGVAVQFGDAILGNTGFIQNTGNLSQVVTGFGGAFNLKR